MEPLIINLEFSGGIELLFGKLKNLSLELSPDQFLHGSATISNLLPFLRDHHLKERAELFMTGDTVRPGILVLINNVDWEIEGGLEYILQPKDLITFISTLHGG